MECLKLSILICVIAFVTAEEAIVEINTKKPSSFVSDKYISFSVDAHSVFGDEKIRSENLELARMLSPAYVRISGLPALQIKPDDWKKCNEWFKSSELTPVVTLEYEPNNWHPRDTIEFLGMSRDIGIENCVWQLGQRLNTTIIPKYSEDILTFDHILDVLTDGGRWGSWKVAAADMVFDWDTKPHKLRTFYSKISPKANVMSLRTLQNTADDSLEEELENDDEEALRWAYSQRTDMWLSRPLIPSMQQDVSHCCERCTEEGLRYARALGDAAMHGYNVLLQDVKLSSIAPNMEFFITLLHKQLMGTTVLDTATLKNDNELIQFYTHCTATNSNDEVPGSITVFGINMDEDEITAIAKITQRPKEGDIMEYILKVKDNEILINDEPANMKEQPFPHIKPIRGKKSITFTLPPRSIGFWVIPANSKACIMAYNHPAKQSANKIFKLRRTSATNLLEELILESLKNSEYKFLDNLKNKTRVKTTRKEIVVDNEEERHKNNQIVCRRQDESESSKIAKGKRPLSELLGGFKEGPTQDTEVDVQDEETENNERVKRDVGALKKPLNTRNSKKIVTSIYTSGLPKKNSAELSIFQQRDNFALPTGDVFAEIGNNNDYEYVDPDADDPFSKKDQYNQYNQQQYVEQEENEDFNTEQGLYRTYDPKYKKMVVNKNPMNNDFFELGTAFKYPTQEKLDIDPGNSYQYRFSRSLREKRFRREPFSKINNQEDFACNNAKNEISKRKQKLYKNGWGKKWSLKKCYDQDIDKNDNKQKANVKQLSNDEVITKQDDEMRSKRSLKNKRKSQAFEEYESQKIKRQIETSALDAQIDKHVKNIQAINDQIAAKLAEHTDSEVIQNLAKIKENAEKQQTALQNHLRETKEKLLNGKNPSLDLINKKTEQLLSSNPLLRNLNHPINLDLPPLPALPEKNWPVLDHKSITDKIHEDLKNLQDRLNQVLHTKSQITLKSLDSEKENLESKELNQKREAENSEVYQPLVEVKHLMKQKRKPLYIKHKEKLEQDQSNQQMESTNSKEAETKMQKRAANKIEHESSKENMVYSNSIQQESLENPEHEFEEIAHKILILDELNNDDNSAIKSKETIIIENINGDDISKEEIIFVNKDNTTEDYILPNNQTYSASNIIDDMASKLSDFVSYVHSQIKHWWS